MELRNRIILAITGASGMPYARRLIEVLCAAGCDVHLTISGAAQTVLKQVNKADATAAQEKFKAVGATVEIK